MLDLSSPRWAELRHAYGSAEDIPALLRELATAAPPKDWQSEPWFSLLSALCHQYDVSTASYAAVPHVVSIATSKKPEERSEHIQFVGAVEALRHRKDAPAIPADLEAAYFAALEDTAALILEDLAFPWDEIGHRIRFGALAAIRGQPELGLNILESEREVCCPNCSTYFAGPGYSLFEEAKRDSG